MRPIRFGYEPTICVSITRDELKILRGACERHYDAAVRTLSIPGRGGILNAANTMLMDSTQEEVEVPFTYRQLDTLCKGLELVGVGQPEDIAKDGARMYLRVRKMMAALGREADRINKAPEATPDDAWWAERMADS